MERTFHIKDFSDHLTLQDEVYVAESASAISFPDDGLDICMQVEEDSFWFKHRNRCILEVVQRYGADQLFFDIGGGNGYVSSALQDSGITTVLVEPGSEGIKNARKREVKHTICATLEDARFNPESIPAIGLFDVVEHIEDDVGFLTEIHRLLEASGNLFITVPAYQFLWSDEDDDTGHFRRYTVPGLVQKLEQIGFAIDYATYIFSVLPLPIFLLRTIPTRLGITRDSHDVKVHQREHRKRPLSDRLMAPFWDYELKRIALQRTIPFGGSCLIAARKK